MNQPEFEKLIAQEFPKAIPEKFRDMVKNVAFLVEDEPSREVRRKERLSYNETLLGLYRGVPRSARGDHYGVGPTVPDVIVLYRLPIHDEAARLIEADMAESFDEALRQVVHDTMWHEVAHYLGIGETEVRQRERVRQEARVAQKPQKESSEHSNAEEMLPPKQAPRRPDKPWRSTMDPIEVEKEDPEMQRMLHTPLISPSENFSSIDSEGGGDGMRNWWEEKKTEKPSGLLPEEIPPPGRPEKSNDTPRQSHKGEPPPNLPTFEQ